MSHRIVTTVVFCALLGAAFWTTTQINAESDTRTLLALNDNERAAVKSEMRKLLVSVSEILSALNSEDMAAIETAARTSGMAMASQVEVSLKKKLPPGFMKLGKSVHVGFDTLADAARDGADKAKILDLLAQQTHRCTACHATYGLK